MALLPPFYLDTVVALGSLTPDDEIQYKATGFLCCYHVEKSDGQCIIFLVTNRHVFRNVHMLKARFNRPIGSDSKIYDLNLKSPNGSPLWTGHPDSNCDVAVIPIAVDLLENDGIEFKYFHDDHQLTLDQAKDLQISEGDGVFILGFPLGQAGEERNYAIVRQGCIARVRDWLSGNSRTILIDAAVFPGNSGGPVITKPDDFAIHGTKYNNRAQLIGMISSYLTYQEFATSKQTGRTRMIFEENSGLVIVVPNDLIQETIEIAVNKPNPSEQATAPETQTE